MASSSLKQSTRYRDSPGPRHRTQNSIQGMTAGDLALFDADEEERGDGPGKSESVDDIQDPFSRDEARTPTLRGVRSVGNVL